MLNPARKLSAPRRARATDSPILAILLALVLLVGAAPASAQVSFSAAAEDPRVDAHLRAILLTTQSNMARVDALATEAGAPSALPISEDYARATPQSVLDLMIEGDVSRTELEGLGVAVGTQAGGVTTAQAPVALVPAILGLPGVREVHASARLLPMLDVSATAIEAPQVWNGTPPVYSGRTGRRIVVGIIDTGFDLTHRDLRTSANKTRVKYVWDQTSAGAPTYPGPPAGFTGGSEYTETMINNGLALTVVDRDGHGTHVAGTAAGSGQATGNGQPAYRYVGVAPEADLVLVQSTLTLESRVIDGVNYIFQKAAALGEPAVVNISSNVLTGDRDGSASLDQGISALTGPGKLVSVSAGNYGNQPLHASISLGANQTGTVQFVIPPYTPNPAALGTEYLEIQAWHDPSATFKVKLRSPNGYETQLVDPGVATSWITTADGNYYISNDIVTSAKGGRRIQVYMNHASDTVPHPAVGTWTITLTRTSTSTTGVCHLWLTRWSFNTVSSPSFSTGVDQNYSVASPATGDSVIATGAYTTKTSWTNSLGSTSSYSGAPPYGTIASFSGRGPRRDGVQRPDVVAPGYGVTAALSIGAAPFVSGVYKMLDLVHMIQYGTSAAAAHTTGALALLLQQTPTLTPSAARLLLIHQAKSDSFTGSVPNPTAGYGKLDVMAHTTAAGDDLAQRFSFAPPFPNPSAHESMFSFSPSSADLSDSHGRVEIRILDVRGRLTATLPGVSAPGPQRLSWNGRAHDGSLVPGGIYFAQLHVGSEISVRKFIRIGS